MNQRFLYIISFCAILLSCSQENEKQIKQIDTRIEVDSNNVSKVKNHTYIDSSEFIVDSTHFGFKRSTKIELLRVDYTDISIVCIKVFRKIDNKWKESNELSIETYALQNLEPLFKDFNNDGFNDLLIPTGTSTRGANEIKTLFLYQPKSNNLLWIKNSEDFPNLDYNPDVNCVNAWIFTGGLRTAFMYIRKDSLVEFADVDQQDGRIVVSVIDKKGNRKVIKNISDKGYSDFAKFRNYNPLVE